MGTPDTNRLENLRSKFLQMTSPQEFGQERKENVTIISRNVPPMLARADAAFIVLTDALRNASPDQPEIDYKLLSEIAADAREQAQNADRLTRADSIRADFTDLIESLDLLCRHLSVLKVISEAELNACKRAESICFHNAQNSEIIFQKIKRDLLIDLQNILADLCPAFLEKRQIFLESFTKADMDRFTHAHGTFTAFSKNRIYGPGHEKN